MVIFTALNIFTIRLHSQENKEELIVISERVGAVLDLEERNTCGLFPTINGFKSATLVKFSNGKYFLKVAYQDETTKEEKEIRYPQNESTIEEFRKQIESIYAPALPDSISKEIDTRILKYIEGQWQIQSIVRIGDNDPDTGDTLSGFGDGYWLESGHFLFWGYSGPKNKYVSLYSANDNKFKRVLTDQADFFEPDSIKKKIRLEADFECYRSDFFSTSRMVYFEIFHSHDHV
jgi:hypothetical protein